MWYLGLLQILWGGGKWDKTRLAMSRQLFKLGTVHMGVHVIVCPLLYKIEYTALECLNKMHLY